MSRGKGRVKDGCFVPFHFVVSGALVAGVSGFLVSPNATLSPRSATEADAWAHFRVSSFKFRLRVDPGVANATDLAAGFVGGIQDTSPATVAAVTELIPSVYLAGGETVPSEWCVVPKADLAGPLPWYKTIPGTADATEEAPGAISVCGNGTSAFAVEVRGVFEFKVSVATANTPKAVALRRELSTLRTEHALELQRDRLLAALAPRSVGTVPAPATGAPVGLGSGSLATRGLPRPGS